MTKIVTISGSLRRLSTNTALLKAAQGRAPEGTEFESAAYADLPHYNEDLGADALQGVERLRAQISQADAILIASPEYNYGIPGPLKNALDWASRPAYRSPFAQKPVGIMGASGGLVGTARCQGQLKQVLLGMAAQVFPYPEFLVAQSSKKFDGNLELTDEDTLKNLEKFLAAFIPWIGKVSAS